MEHIHPMSGMDMPADSHGGHDDDSTFGAHGMALVGEETLYLSHLPMFMPPHNFQVILEVLLNDEARGRLQNFRARFGRNELYTFNPEKFHITELISVGSDRPARNSFTGSLFRGHFEKGGALIAEEVTVHVEKVIHFEEIGTGAVISDLEYLLFGKGQEFFLAHWITQPPDFDQLLSVKVVGPEFTDEEMGREHQGVHVAFLERHNTPQERIKPGEKLSGQGHVTGAHQFIDLQVEAQAEIYFEEGELRQDATFDPTREEKAAGFGQ